jgi:hypothetical protein
MIIDAILESNRGPLHVPRTAINKGGSMIRIATLLGIVACLTIIGCQPPEGIMAGVSKEDFDALMTKVEKLEADVASMHESMETLVEEYNAHIEKYHKGGTTVPTMEKQSKPTRVGGK